MEARATARTVLLVPRKGRLVLNLIRGKKVSEAMAILNNLNKKSARLAKKVLVSAVANAENNFKMNKDNLFVKEAYINDGPILKRRRIGSRSHIDRHDKKTSHIIFIIRINHYITKMIDSNLLNVEYFTHGKYMILDKQSLKLDYLESDNRKQKLIEMRNYWMN